MVEMILPDGSYVSSIVANLNVFISNPATSKGEGEIIYNSTTNKVYVNIGTTGSPNWYDISGSGEPTSHDLLNNLTWSTAGHTIDATLDMNNNNLTEVQTLTFNDDAYIVSPSLSNSINFKVLSADLLGLTNSGNTSYKTLAMNSQKITGLAAPTTNGDAVRYEHLSADDHTQYFLADGSRDMSGSLNLNSNYLTNVGAIGFGSAPTLVTTDGGTITFKAAATEILDIEKTLVTMKTNLDMENNDIINIDSLTGRSDLELAITSSYQNLVLYSQTGYQIDATSEIDMNDNKIVRLLPPVADTDAATKAYSDLVGVTVCTSGTRPSATEGKVIYETDTENTLIYNGTSWEALSGWVGTATSDLDMADYNITNSDTIQAKSTNSLTFKVSTGKSFVFQKV